MSKQLTFLIVSDGINAPALSGTPSNHRGGVGHPHTSFEDKKDKFILIKNADYHEFIKIISVIWLRRAKG